MSQVNYLTSILDNKQPAYSAFFILEKDTSFYPVFSFLKMLDCKDG